MAVLTGQAPVIPVAPASGTVDIKGFVGTDPKIGLGGVISISAYGAASAALFLGQPRTTATPQVPEVTIYPVAP